MQEGKARSRPFLLFSGKLDFSLPCLLKRQAASKKNDIVDVFESIWRGGMPDVLQADAAEISQPTAKEWLRILQGLGIIYLLPPFSNNELKRLSKTPKLYFCDTGLCAYLSMWLTRDTLMNGAASGHYFENYVVTELIKNYSYSPDRANLTYYRDSNANEIDVIVKENGLIHPLEIKKSANPDRREIKKYERIDKTKLERGCGGIICMCEEVIPIDRKNCFIPCNLI